MKIITKKLIILLALLSFRHPLFAQHTLSLQDCINIAVKQNLSVRSEYLKAVRDKALQKIAFNPDKTELTLGQDPTSGGSNENAISITQNIAWPGVYVRQSKVLKQQVVLSQKEKELTTAEIVREVKLKYFNAVYQLKRLAIYSYLDSLYSDFVQKAEVRTRTGETSTLEALAAKNKLWENTVQKEQIQADYEREILSLKQLMNTEEDFVLVESAQRLNMNDMPDSLFTEKNASLKLAAQNIQLANAKMKLEQSKLMPDLVFGYSQQYVLKNFNPADIQRDYFPGTRIGGFQVGIALPVFAGSYIASVKAGKAELDFTQNQYAVSQQLLKTQWQQELKNYHKFRQSLDYYINSGLELAKEQLRVAQISFARGEIGYVEYFQSITQATEIRLNYLNAVNALEQSKAELEFMMGE